MRYQAKPYRSFSFLQRQALRDSKQNKENKENSNVLNLPASKPNRSIKDYDLVAPRLKLETKVSETTNCTTMSHQSTSQLLKRTYTQLICKDYSQNILRHICESAESKSGMLNNHGISSSLRSKMVDWMIQVLSSYKMSEETFFRSIYLMDGYLKHSKARLEVKDLHLVGVTSMFSAAKYQEIHPLKLNIIFDKIARKKFSKNEILQKQSDIIASLDFKLEASSVYDIARHAVQQMKIPLSQLSKKYFTKIVLYLSKMALFNSDLAEQDLSLLAGAVVFISLKTLEQVDNSAQPESYLSRICDLVGVEQEMMIEVSRKVLDLAKNFSKFYPSLTNLKKFNKFEYGTD